MHEPFQQHPPTLANQYADDRVLRSFLRRALPPAVLGQVAPELLTMGDRAGGELYRLQLADRCNEPTLTQWDAWGERVDQIALSPLWQRAARRTICGAGYTLIEGQSTYDERNKWLGRGQRRAALL
jgi:acyl-CoA dehydrogenase